MGTRSILKRKSAKQSKGIKWDEDNLMITEQQKSSTMKIDEPKTPFIHYNQSTDNIVGSANGITPQELQQAMDDANFSLEHDPQKHENVDAEEDWESGSQSGSQTDDQEQEKVKRIKFNQMRAQHYNMKAVLKHAKELIDNEESDPKFSDPNAYNVGDNHSTPPRDEDEEEDY